MREADLCLLRDPPASSAKSRAKPAASCTRHSAASPIAPSASRACSCCSSCFLSCPLPPRTTCRLQGWQRPGWSLEAHCGGGRCRCAMFTCRCVMSEAVCAMLLGFSAGLRVQLWLHPGRGSLCSVWSIQRSSRQLFSADWSNCNPAGDACQSTQSQATTCRNAGGEGAVGLGWGLTATLQRHCHHQQDALGRPGPAG